MLYVFVLGLLPSFPLTTSYNNLAFSRKSFVSSRHYPSRAEDQTTRSYEDHIYEQ